MKEINPKNFLASGQVKLKNHLTSFSLEADEGTIEDKLEEVRKQLADWQDKLYAHGKYAVLFCLQGMDTSGKDSLIREIFKDLNARGVVVHSFKVPTSLELKHDFLWRHYIALPSRGKFGVFNRTHYENVLVTRVHPEYILKENLPEIKEVSDITEEFWERRFEDIRNFEKHLTESGTIIIKFFLNISKEEQRQRLLRRLNVPNKNWKFSPGDLEERKLWDEYKDYYEDAIKRTSLPHAPWYIIPADDKSTARYITAKILLEKLLKYEDVEEPELAPEIQEKLAYYKEQLSKE